MFTVQRPIHSGKIVLDVFARSYIFAAPRIQIRTYRKARALSLSIEIFVRVAYTNLFKTRLFYKIRYIAKTYRVH